jgi:hypothetical protein
MDMAAFTSDLLIRKLNTNCTLNVRIKITRQFRLRLKAAFFLIHLAAKLLGCGIKIQGESNGR